MDTEEPEEMEEEHVPDVDSSQIDLPLISTQELAQTSKKQRVDDGVIEKIVLKNFMCHKHCEVELNTNVNFIIGRNGSGKSAIMTAIVVGLGGKASNTQRASSLPTLVRSGCNEAEITLTLRNSGSEAYKFNDYGKTITVIRQIKRDGGGSYKLKAANGHIIAQTKEELIRILDHFNIQVDNPVSMLSQDTSRNFLHSSNPAAKYRLFMKGTHLDQIAHDYAQAEEQQKLMIEEIKRKIEILPELEKKAKELEEEVQDIGRLDNLENRLGDLSLELSWAIVKKIETRAESATRVLKDEEEKLKKTNEKVEKIKSAREKKKKGKDEVMDELQEIKKEVVEVEKEREEILKRKREIEKLLRNGKSEGTRINREIEKVKSEKKAFEDKLEESRKQSLRDLEGERKELLDQEEELQRQLKEKNDKLDTAHKDRRDKENQLREKDNEMRQNSSEVSHVRQQINDCEDTLRRLQSAEQDSLQMYGGWMVDIARAIERNKRRFKLLPKGPLGSYVRVRDQNWCCAIEVAIGFGNLIGFIVDNQEDGDILREIIKQVLRNHPGKPYPSVLTSSFDGRVYNVSQNMPHCNYPTIMSMIEVRDPDVLNMLIDMCSIETTILITDKREARGVMGNHPPTNARSAYTIEGDQALPNNRYYSNKRNRPMGILQTSVQEGMAQQKRSLAQLQDSLTILEESNHGMENTCTQLRRELGGIKTYISRETTNAKKIQNDIDAVKARREEIDSTDQEEDIATWEGIIRELDEKLAGLRQSFSVVKDDMTSNLRQLKEEDVVLQSHEDKVKEVMGRVQEVRRRLKRVSDDLDKVNNALSVYEDREKKLENNLKDTKRKAEQFAKIAAEKVEETAQLGDRVETNRTETSVQSEIEKIEKKLREEAGRRANQKEIKEKYLEAVEAFQTLEQSILQEKDSLKKLKNSLKMRIVGYTHMRMRISNRARLYFTNIVRKRGYEGTLDFNIEKRKLDIIVKVDKSQATKNISSLSGGERSFSTVSFVMALWEAVESPFRCLDEFDVFMDLMNRKISMQLMLEEAKLLGHRQFIFFTPQDMSALGLKLGNYKVLQLQPPDRTQQTLD